MENVKTQTEMRDQIAKRIEGTPLQKEFDMFDTYMNERLASVLPQYDSVEELDSDTTISLEITKTVLDETFKLMKKAILNVVHISSKEELEIYLELVNLMKSFDESFVSANMRLEENGLTGEEAKLAVQYYMENSQGVYNDIISLLEAIIRLY